MSKPIGPSMTAGELRTPVTPAGRVLAGLLARHLPGIESTAAQNDRDGVFPTATFEAFRQDGVLGATVPAELGGLGVTKLYDVATALASIAEADAATALALHVQYSRGLTLTYEWRHGSPEASALAERLLRGMATGEARVCGAVKDHHSVVTELLPDGSGGWVLRGRKTLVSMTPVATHFFAYAKKQVDGQPSTLVAPLLRRDTPGLSVLETWDGLGMRASGTSDIVFDDCPVSLDDVLTRGPLDVMRGDAVLAGQTVSSITMLGIYLGIAQAARDLAIRAAARRAPAVPAASRTLIAEIDTRLYTARAVAAAAIENADLVQADVTADPDERGRRMMTPFQHAKMMVNQLTLAIVNDCLTVVGGAAYSASHPLSRLYRDIRAGWFMQPYTYVDGVDFLSAQALRLNRENSYMNAGSTRAA